MIPIQSVISPKLLRHENLKLPDTKNKQKLMKNSRAFISFIN